MRTRRRGEELIVIRFWKMENRWTSSNRTNRPKEVNPKLGVRKVRNQPADAPQVQEQITLVTPGERRGGKIGRRKAD